VGEAGRVVRGVAGTPFGLDVFVLVVLMSSGSIASVGRLMFRIRRCVSRCGKLGRFVLVASHASHDGGVAM
jgi:hypothetical protein